jgi:hypothetical protein
VTSSDDGYLNLQLGNITNCFLLWLETLKDSNHYNSILDIRKLLQSLAWGINITACMGKHGTDLEAYDHDTSKKKDCRPGFLGFQDFYLSSQFLMDS